MCAPDLVHGNPALKEPEDLDKHTLIHSEQRLTLVGMDARQRLRRGFRSASPSLLPVRAFTQGRGQRYRRGAGKPCDCLRVSHLGQLIEPFPHLSRSGAAYHLVVPPQNLNLPKTIALRDWLIDEAERDRQSDDG